MSCSMCERSEKAMEQKVDLSETLKDIYTLQCRADLDTDHFYVFQAQPAIKAELDKKQNAVQCMEHLTEKYVAPAYRKICRDFYDLSTLQERLRGKQFLTCVYQNVGEQWLLATAVPERMDPDGTLHSVVFLVRNSTAQIAERITTQDKLKKSNRSLDENQRILHSMQNIYFSGFYVDLETDAYRTLFVAPWIVDFTPPVGRFSRFIQDYLSFIVLPECHEELQRALSRSYIQKALHKETLTVARHCFTQDYRSFRLGEYKWNRVTIIPVDLDDSGAPIHVLVMLQDITDAKQTEMEYQRQILESARRAQQANDAKTEFLHRISHDIRTPINGIQGMLRIAEYYSDDPVKRKQCRDKIWSASNYLLDLVNDVLDMSKLESGNLKLEMQPFNMNELLDQIDPIMEAQTVERGIQYEVVRNPRTHLELVGSTLYIRQILLNIAGNALKYNRPGGFIKVACRELSSTEDTALYQFVCEDSGQGMSKEFQKRMFEPFTQENSDARTNYQGTGLGLAITKGLIDQMGGTIEVQSEKGMGSTFTVNLPLAINKAAVTAVRPSDSPAQDILRGTTILLVEDNALNAEVAEFLLEHAGASVLKAWNGQEGVEQFLRSSPGEIDAILMDVMMPVLDGLSAARRLRALDRPDAKTVPIVAMTANAFVDDMEKTREAGMNAHLSKPLDSEKLLTVLAKLIQKE